MSKRERRDPNENGLEAQIKFMDLCNTILETPMNHSILTSLKELDGIKKNRVKELKRESNKF